jgi:hypothetical protein
MQGEAIYECWAPPDGVWSLWARPVLFAQMPDRAERLGTPAVPVLSWSVPDDRATALVVDLPGGESVAVGLALAERGYRPVPVYNACTGEGEVIDMAPVVEGLRAGAPWLQTLPLPAEAPPAFLLDARRQGGVVVPAPGQFDNRWEVFPQDFPSADFLKSRGIGTVLLVQRGRQEPREDLTHVLLRWQEAGLGILSREVTEAGPAAGLRVARPSRYRAFWYRALAFLGLRRNALGGFGAVVPRPSQG